MSDAKPYTTEELLRIFMDIEHEMPIGVADRLRETFDVMARERDMWKTLKQDLSHAELREQLQHFRDESARQRPVVNAAVAYDSCSTPEFKATLSRAVGRFLSPAPQPDVSGAGEAKDGGKDKSEAEHAG
jgi:hypothetical protein